MKRIGILAEPPHASVLAQLPYFVDWRPRLWVPTVRWLLGDPVRFQGKTVLELGCRSGRMSCLFGLLGAEVLGVDLPGVSLEPARQEAVLAGVTDRVRFRNYSGDPATLPEMDFDFVFTKSVLVMISPLQPFIAAVAQKLKPDGQLLAAENLAGGWIVQFLRRVIMHPCRGKSFLDRFHAVDAALLATLTGSFTIIEQRMSSWLVAGIRARRRCESQGSSSVQGEPPAPEKAVP
jgi:SAM-dependent methyltransferase